MIQFIMDHWTSIIEGLATLGVVVEVSPIKIYPLRWIGNRFNAGLKEKLDESNAELKKEIDDVNKKLDKHIDSGAKKDMKDLRHQILDFSDRITEGSKPSKDAFTHTFDIAVDYHNLIEEYNLTNGVIDIEMENIKKKYAELYLNKKDS